MDVHGFQRRTEKHVVELEKIVDMPKPITCPNIRCGKTLQKALVLTDPSKKPRTTYYACPHCFSEVEIVVKEETPSLECPYYFGFLKTLPKKTPIPDDCLTCPKIIRCKKGKAS
ncbi:MAG: hypothetical protein ACE5J6_02220 [Candidatus Bathyarchaeia archaeon]